MAPIISQDSLVRLVEQHLLKLWPDTTVRRSRWDRGPVEELGTDFVVFECCPTKASNNLWVYCTAGTGAGEPHQQRFHEFVLTAPEQSNSHTETLTMLAHYHRFESALDVGHIVPIGKPWLAGSGCDRLLLSLPYPFGQKLEWLNENELEIRFLWALPITSAEAFLAKHDGVEALERLFDRAKLNYWNPLRESVV